MNNSEEKTLLFNGLPAVKCEDYWVVISPYAGEIVRIPKEQISEPEIKMKLAKKGFFGKPAEKGPSALSDYFQLTLITTSDCNLKCRYCFASAGESKNVMKDDVAISAVRYAIKSASGRDLLISFFGGEPSMTKQLIKKVVGFARAAIIGTDVKRVRFNITTNGVMSLEFLKYLIDNDFFLTISMDGLPSVQDYQRPLKNGKASSPFLERTIKTLVERNHEFIIRATITDYSVAYLLPTIYYLNTLGVTQFHCEAINIAGRAKKEVNGQLKRPTAEDFTANLKAAIIKAGELGIGILNSSYMNLMQPSLHFCDGMGGNRVSVSYTGDVTTCLEVQDECHPTADDFLVGAYDKTKDMIVMNQKKQTRACSSIITSQNSCCQNCFAIYICGGGCPIRNYHMVGDHQKIDPFRCEVTKSVLPFIINLFDQASEEV